MELVNTCTLFKHGKLNYLGKLPKCHYTGIRAKFKKNLKPSRVPGASSLHRRTVIWWFFANFEAKPPTICKIKQWLIFADVKRLEKSVNAFTAGI
jgi:hypothetical protein